MLQVKNWSQFQHYGDRNPLWVKVYLAILDDYGFASLSDAEAGQLMKIWLLAAKSKGTLPNDAKWIAGRINATSRLRLQRFIDLGFLIEADAGQSASELLARPEGNPEPIATLEKEREKRKKVEEETNNPSPRVEATTVAGWDEFLAEVPAGPLQDSIADAMRSARHPDALRRTLVALTKSIEGGPAYRPPLIAKAIEELLVNGPVTPIGLRTFCENLARGAKPALKVVNGGAPPAQPLPRL